MNYSNRNIIINDDRSHDLSVSELLRKVYWWMAAGLGITGLTALITVNNATLLPLVFSSTGMLVLVIAELALVISLSAAIQRLSFTQATLLYLLYSIVNGLTMSSIFLLYTKESITSTFFITAGTFGAMALYGSVTKKDLSKLGHYAFMALIGLIIASLVNLFLKSGQMAWIISLVGVLVFVALTAYDTQKIRVMLEQFAADDESGQKLALLGALTLYLDFINLFLYLLRFFGRGRD